MLNKLSVVNKLTHSKKKHQDSSSAFFICCTQVSLALMLSIDKYFTQKKTFILYIYSNTKLCVYKVKVIRKIL